MPVSEKKHDEAVRDGACTTQRPLNTFHCQLGVKRSFTANNSTGCPVFFVSAGQLGGYCSLRCGVLRWRRKRLNYKSVPDVAVYFQISGCGSGIVLR